MNLNPNLRTEGETNISLKSTQIDESGTDIKSTKKTTESPHAGSDSSRRTRQAIWRRVTVGNDGALAGAVSGAGVASGVGPTFRWVRAGFHSASRATTEERLRAHRRKESSGESATDTMRTSNGGGLGFGFRDCIWSRNRVGSSFSSFDSWRLEAARGTRQQLQVFM